jgi:hypothetical protein
MVSSYTAGGFVHLLLVIAVIVVVFQFIGADPSEGAAVDVRGGTAAGGRSEVLLDRPNGGMAMRPLRGFGILVLTILLASAWGCGSTATKEGTGEYVDDSVITAKVKAAIFNDSTLKVNEINVETFKGVVQLSGFVRSQADINKAVQVARGVAGVKSVKNDMRIK